MTHEAVPMSGRHPVRALDGRLTARLPLLAVLVLVVLTTGVVGALRLERGAAAAVAAAPAAHVVVLPAAQVAPVPVDLRAEPLPTPVPAPEPAAPAAPPPPAPAPTTGPPAPTTGPPVPAPAAVPTTTPASADKLCSGPGWEQRRGQAALASLRRPADAARFTVEFASGRSGFIGLATVHERRLEVFVRPCAQLSMQLLRHVVAHELGHLVDGDRMTDALRAEYRAVRGIPADTPWYGCNSCADFATPAGDFAEVYAQWQRGASSNRSELAGAPSPAELEQIAARFFR